LTWRAKISGLFPDKKGGLGMWRNWEKKKQKQEVRGRKYNVGEG
jgi:hypothetical protein